MSKARKYVLFCDKMSHWRSFGVSYNWDDGHYFGFYVSMLKNICLLIKFMLGNILY